MHNVGTGKAGSFIGSSKNTLLIEIIKNLTNLE